MFKGEASTSSSSSKMSISENIAKQTAVKINQITNERENREKNVIIFHLKEETRK